MKIIANGPVLELTGSPYEQGRRIGSETVDDIVANVEMVRGERETVLRAGMTDEEYDAVLRANERFVAEASPETLDEIRGVADGSGLRYEDLLDLNLMAYFPLRRLTAECSQLIVAPPRTASGHWFHTKTRDMPLPSLRQTVLHRVGPDGTELAEVIHSGAVTSPGSGVNSHGLSLSTSGVWPKSGRYTLADASRGWNLVNPHLMLRDCATVDDVEDAIVAMPRLTGMNVLATDGTSAASFEVTADGHVRTDLADGHVILTNHCPSPQLADRSPTRAEYASTFDRYDRLTELATGAQGWTEDDVWQAMSDHQGYPNSSVCRHPDPDHADSSVTAYASVATLPEQTFRVVLGTTCTLTGSSAPSAP